MINCNHGASFLFSEEEGVEYMCAVWLFLKRNYYKYHPEEIFQYLNQYPSINFDEGFFIIRFFSVSELLNDKYNKGRNIFNFVFSEKNGFFKRFSFQSILMVFKDFSC